MERILTRTVTPEEDGMLLREVLRGGLKLSARQISRAKFAEKGLLVNGEERTVRAVLKSGDVISVQLESAQSGSMQLIPCAMPLSILYEDEDLVVVNKPAGIVVHPSPGHYADSLANGLVAHYREMNQEVVVRPIGRLDRETSGVIAFGKHKAAVRALELQRNNGTLRRIYHAIVEHCPPNAEGIIDLPIGEEGSIPMKQAVRPDGKRAVTEYRVIKRFSDASLVELHLLTGRTHQIRVHMAAVGCPLVGDALYGNGPVPGMERTALHSIRLSFQRPFEEKILTVEGELPEDFSSYLSNLSQKEGN